jgi:hypothetical protein
MRQKSMQTMRALLYHQFTPRPLPQDPSTLVCPPLQRELCVLVWAPAAQGYRRFERAWVKGAVQDRLVELSQAAAPPRAPAAPKTAAS